MKKGGTKMDKENILVASDLISLHRMSAEDIERIKMWQWRFMYNTIAVQAIIVWLFRNCRASETLFGILIAGCIIVTIVSVSLVLMNQCHLKHRREEADMRAEVLREKYELPFGPQNSPMPFHLYAIVAVSAGCVTTSLLIYTKALYQSVPC